MTTCNKLINSTFPTNQDKQNEEPIESKPAPETVNSNPEPEPEPEPEPMEIQTTPQESETKPETEPTESKSEAELLPPPSLMQPPSEPIEDISNEAYMQRHERALAEEKKRFITFLKFPYSTRSRANRRIDSQADSSGANTPDPMSPAPNTPAPATNNDQEVSELV